MRRELVFFYGYDLSSLSSQQRNDILSAYEAKLKNLPNPSENFDEDDALGIRRPDGVHCPLVEMLEPYENGYEDEIEELLLQKKAADNREKLNGIEKEILKRRDTKVRGLMKMKLEDESSRDDNELNRNGKRKLKEDDGERENPDKKPKIERYSASTTPTTPVAKFSIPFILNPENPIDTGPKEKLPKYYISPMGLYRDYFGVDERYPYFYHFRFSHHNQPYFPEMELMTQVETLAKAKETEIHEFFDKFGVSIPPCWMTTMFSG